MKGLDEATGAAKVRALVETFDHIARTRMAGLPLLHPELQVEAVGFQADAGTSPGEAGWCGVLVTPWFMNLVWLPADPSAAAWPAGSTRTRELGGLAFDFIGADEPGVGLHAGCSLFSPMFEFVDQAAARATAEAVLVTLRRAPSSTDGTAQARGPVGDRASPQAARRGFLFGRTSSGAAR